jgi:hypothetical protein
LLQGRKKIGIFLCGIGGAAWAIWWRIEERTALASVMLISY